MTMDSFLKCYLDQFHNCPRNTLHDRRNRRSVVDYISTLIGGCSQGLSSDLDKTVQEAIGFILRYHEENRVENGDICKMGRFHNILYVAVRLCYCWQLTDTPTVTKLLTDIFSCENTYERIFIGAIFGNKAPHYIAGWKSDFDTQEENLRACVYFLDHANRGNLEMVLNEETVRFIDVPLDCCGKASPASVSLQLGLPDKVLIFLRFGAVIPPDMVEYHLKRLMEFHHVYPYKLVTCLQIILRATPTLPIAKSVVFEHYSDLVDDDLIPFTRCGVASPELKHLARCTIRDKLRENFQLPNGIQLLSIPDSLKAYIDIMED